jgi:hypothetical protein
MKKVCMITISIFTPSRAAALGFSATHRFAQGRGLHEPGEEGHESQADRQYYQVEQADAYRAYVEVDLREGRHGELFAVRLEEKARKPHEDERHTYRAYHGGKMARAAPPQAQKSYPVQ